MTSYINSAGLVLVREDSTYITLPLKDGEYTTEGFASDRIVNMVFEAKSFGLVETFFDGENHHVRPAERTLNLAA
jgi:hypothetical protein